MIAPPHVQAQSFAKAILTDIAASLFCPGRSEKPDGSGIPSCPLRSQQMQTIGLSASALTLFLPEMTRIRGVGAASVPKLNRLLRQVNGSGKTRTPIRRAIGAGESRVARFGAEAFWRRGRPDEPRFLPPLSDLCRAYTVAIGRLGWEA